MLYPGEIKGPILVNTNELSENRVILLGKIHQGFDFILMNNFLNQHKQSVTRIVMFAFVVSWFSLIGQASAHSFMMFEMQQHKAMGHDMSSHCQPVLCETVISLDDQTSYGLDSVSVIDLNTLPAFQLTVVADLVATKNNHWIYKQSIDDPPLEKTGILRI